MTADSTSEGKKAPISIGLLSRHSLLGGAVVLGVALFYLVGVPFINGLVKGENPFEVGQPYEVFDSYEITPQEGWQLEANDLFVTLTKAGASLVFTRPAPADQTPEEAIETARQTFQADTSGTWQVGEATAFVTDAGDQGVTISGHAAEKASQTWVTTDGTSNVTVLASSPSSVWASVTDEMEAMVKSIVFLSDGDGK